MTKNELEEAVKSLGWTNKVLAEKFGVTPKTAWSWRQGNAEVPKYVEYGITLVVQLKRLVGSYE